MVDSMMTNVQQSVEAEAGQWALPAGEAVRLSIGPGPRELHVTQGRLWLTRTGSARAPAEDLWLEAGDTLAMESGSAWVIEGWGATRFQLLVPPRACRALAQRFSAAGSRAASSSRRRFSFWPVAA